MSDGTFLRVIQQYAAPLARVAAGYAIEASEQEDLLQEIYVALWRALPAFRGESSELTFVLSVAHNRGISFAARTKRRQLAPLPAGLPDSGIGPDGDAEQRERAAALYSAIRQLPPVQRQAIMLHLEGLSGKEIAAAQGTTENNVNVRLNRARGILRSLLADLEGR